MLYRELKLGDPGILKGIDWWQYLYRNGRYLEIWNQVKAKPRCGSTQSKLGGRAYVSHRTASTANPSALFVPLAVIVSKCGRAVPDLAPDRAAARPPLRLLAGLDTPTSGTNSFRRLRHYRRAAQPPQRCAWYSKISLCSRTCRSTTMSPLACASRSRATASGTATDQRVAKRCDGFGASRRASSQDAAPAIGGQKRGAWRSSVHSTGQRSSSSTLPRLRWYLICARPCIELKRMHRDLDRTFVYIPHDPQAKLTMTVASQSCRIPELLQVGNPRKSICVQIARPSLVSSGRQTFSTVWWNRSDLGGDRAAGRCHVTALWTAKRGAAERCRRCRPRRGRCGIASRRVFDGAGPALSAAWNSSSGSWSSLLHATWPPCSICKALNCSV